MKQSLIITAALLFFYSPIKSQDPKFLDANQSLLYLNPSFAGSNGGTRVQTSYQNQWPEYSARFLTYQASADVYIPSMKGGLGLSWMEDAFMKNVLKTDVIGLTYAQHLRLTDKLTIIPSVQISYRQKRFDPNATWFWEGFDPRYGGTYPTWPPPTMASTFRWSFDFSGGALFNYRKNLYFGVYYFHINEPDMGLLGSNPLPAQLAFYGSYNFHISSTQLLQISARVEDQMDYVYSQINVNAVLYSHLVAGLGVTSFEGGTVNLGLRFDTFSIVGSYNYYNSRLAGMAASIVGLNASLNLRNKENRHNLVSFENW